MLLVMCVFVYLSLPHIPGCELQNNLIVPRYVGHVSVDLSFSFLLPEKYSG